MNAALGERYARGEFEIRVIDGERVERQIRLRMYGFLFVEYRYPDGKPSQWGVLFPGWPNEMLMSTNQANVLRHALNDYLDRGSPFGAITRQRITTGERMNPGLDEVFPPTPEVWAELAQYLTAGDHQLGKAVRFLEEEEGGTDPKLLAERLGVKGDYAAWLLTHARKMKGGIIRVVVSEKNDGRETASIQAHHYRYVLDDDLTPETRHYVETVIAKFRTVNPDIPMKAANAQGARDSHEQEIKSEPAQCTNPNCEWAWTHHGGECS